MVRFYSDSQDDPRDGKCCPYSYHIIIRHSGAGWRWRLMEYDQQVATGKETKWIDAQKAAVVARKQYVKQIKEGKKRLRSKKKLDAQ